MKTVRAWLNRGFHKQMAVAAIGCIMAFTGFMILFTAEQANRDMGWALQLFGTAVTVAAIFWGLIEERRQHREHRP